MKDKPFKLNSRKNANLKATLTLQSTRRTNPDIKKWRDALNYAEDIEDPNRSDLYDIYQETMLDGMITSATERIYLKCANSRIVFTKDGEADNDHPISQMVQTPIFLDILRWIVESKWYGHSLIELMIKDMQIESAQLIPRKHVVQEKGIVIKREGDQTGIYYRQPPYSNHLLEVGKPDDLGLLNKATPYAIFKRFGFSSWGEFVELFGIPQQEYNYDPNIPGSREEVERQAKNQGSGAKIIMPAGTTTKIHQGASGSGSSVFKDYKEANDEEILLIFLLQTMTTKDGSSRSQAEVHQGGEDELIAGYKLFVEMVLNYQLQPLLAKHGFDVEGGKFKYEDTEKLSKKQLLELIKGLSHFGEVSLDFIEENFGIKLTPKEREVIETEQKLQSKKKSRYELNCDCTALEQQEMLLLNFTEEEESELLERIYNLKGEARFDSSYFRQLADGLIQEMDSAWNNSNLDYNSPDHLAKSLLELNTFRFSATKDIELTKELNELLKGAESFADFENQAAPLLSKYNRNYLATEYKLAKSTAQSNANYLRNMEVAEEFPYWEYTTVGDDKVRPAHAALDGKYFRAGEVGTLQTPNGYNCRCEYIPRTNARGKKILSEEEGTLLLGDEYSSMKKAGFAVNRAEQGVVFTEQQMYDSKFKEGSLNYKNFGLAAYATIGKTAIKATTRKRTKAQAEEWFSLRLSEYDNTSTKSIRLLDYNQRPIDMSKKTLLKNKNWQLLDLLPDALNNPDEVYFERVSKNKQLVRILKYYAPRPLLIELAITNKAATVTSWSFAKNITLARTGLLIKQS